MGLGDQRIAQCQRLQPATHSWRLRINAVNRASAATMRWPVATSDRRQGSLWTSLKRIGL